jgi:hypothetical protein
MKRIRRSLLISALILATSAAVAKPSLFKDTLHCYAVLGYDGAGNYIVGPVVDGWEEGIDYICEDIQFQICVVCSDAIPVDGKLPMASAVVLKRGYFWLL